MHDPIDAKTAVGKAKFFYKICLNESEISDSWRASFDEVMNLFGGWPSLGSHVLPGASVEKLYGVMVSKFRGDFLFKATVQPDDKNSEQHVLLIDQPSLNLFARDFYVLAENEEKLAYLTLIRDVLVLLNARPDIATKDAEEIIDFETSLANITMADEQRHDIAELYTKMTLGDMRRQFRHFDWILFFQSMFEDVRSKVEEMISLIMESFVHLLLEEDWLTEETKQFAKQKVNTMKRKIGYPDYLNDTSAVDDEYKHYEVFEGKYYRTKFQFYEQYQKDVLGRIAEPVDRERWVAGAALVNAFYSPNTNEIIFPAGILQPVFYSKEFPSSMNFGGIGVAECIEEQYSGYVLEQIAMRINGRSTKGENIADNGGLRMAYKSYKKYEKAHSIPPRLPGVNLTHDQLFFLNYAQIWCGTMNDKEALRKLRTSEHSPGPIRVKGPLSNSEDFARVYNCPRGSPMNPQQKCRVW
ncbi:hypothetical protein WR25_24720 [Diploscapter pachys]|uniref:Peptidase M13 C-terminal domain-containing protein n=1 Tax=Diploscapter pachys TaxID=2018661 RepID=A0A2A2L9Q1_9BILA|nr:hypothetical protein WR25_24720 [Diploscapter pachys]